MNKFICIVALLLASVQVHALPVSVSAPVEVSHMVLGGHPFNLEVARTPAQWQKGLSKRSNLKDNEGMVFVFDREQLLHFWMRETLIPLDIIYFNSDGSFNSVYKNVPSCKLPKYTSAYCPNYASKGSARFVVELKGGTLERLGISTSNLVLPISKLKP